MPTPFPVLSTSLPRPSEQLPPHVDRQLQTRASALSASLLPHQQPTARTCLSRSVRSFRNSQQSLTAAETSRISSSRLYTKGSSFQPAASCWTSPPPHHLRPNHASAPTFAHPHKTHKQQRFPAAAGTNVARPAKPEQQQHPAAGVIERRVGQAQTAPPAAALRPAPASPRATRRRRRPRPSW